MELYGKMLNGQMGTLILPNENTGLYEAKGRKVKNGKSYLGRRKTAERGVSKCGKRQSGLSNLRENVKH